MIHQPKSLSSLVCDKIVQSLAYHLCKDQSLKLPADAVNQVMNQAIRTVSFESSIPCKIWKLAHCTEVSVQSPISAKNIQILCTLWRKTLTTLSFCKGDFQYTEFLGDSFEKLHTLKIEHPKNLCKTQLLNLCLLLPDHLEECTIAYCNDLDNDVLKTLLERCPFLKVLNIAGCKQVSAITSPVTNVRSLDISGTQINDQVLFDIKKEYLVYLNCSHTSISNIGLKSIEMSCGKTLKGLDIQYCPYITHLGDGFTNLVMLGTYKTSIPISSCPAIMLQLPNAHGRPLLHYATVFKDQLLITNILEKISRDKKSDILQIQDSQGNLILHVACQTGQEDLALELIRNMDSKMLELQGALKKTALHFASQKGLNRVACILIKKIPFHVLAAQDIYGDTALHWACRIGQEDLALELIQNMDSKILGLQGTDKKTALHWAIAQNLNKVISMLSKNMFTHDLEVRDIYGDTALHLACLIGQEDFALDLIQNINSKALGVQGTDKKTALHIAIERGRSKVVSILIENMSSYDLQAQDIHGNTVLHLACRTEREDVVLRLIYKMNPEALGLQGMYKQTPLHVAIENTRSKVISLLMKKMSFHALAAQNIYGDTVLHLACRPKQENLALELIHHMDPKALGLQEKYRMQTALHWAIVRGLYVVAKVLADKMDKDSIQLTDCENKTALSLAIEYQQEELILLIKMKLSSL